MIYYKYSDYLKNKYGEKVYKLPISIPCSCPNRDGTLATGGCTFCGDDATGFELLPDTVPVSEQVSCNRARIGKSYGAKKFIAYFQNFSNTYLPLDRLEAYLREAAAEDVVQIALSTRPDCISEPCLRLLARLSEELHTDIAIELGVQTVNYKTLAAVNRGHGLAELIDACAMIRPFGFEIGCHVILNLPGDTIEDAVETARVLSALRVTTVKLHSLYLLKNSELARQYQNGEFTLISKEEYIRRVIAFLRFLDPGIAVQRLLARAPEGDSLFCNWGTGWWKIKDEIDAVMTENGFSQGDFFDYLGGKAVRFHQKDLTKA